MMINIINQIESLILYKIIEKTFSELDLTKIKIDKIIKKYIKTFKKDIFKKNQKIFYNKKLKNYWTKY